MVNTCAFIEAARQESIDTVLALADARKPGREARGHRLHGRALRRRARRRAARGRRGRRVRRRGLAGARRCRWARRGASPPACATCSSCRAPAPTVPWAYVKVAEGCDRACAFCAIPSFRGKQRSRTPESIEAEVARPGRRRRRRDRARRPGPRLVRARRRRARLARAAAAPARPARRRRPRARPAPLPLPERGARPAGRDHARARRPSCPTSTSRCSTPTAPLLRAHEAVGERRPVPRRDRRHPRARSPTPRSGRRSSSASPARPKRDHDELLAFLDAAAARLGRLLPVLARGRHAGGDAARRGRPDDARAASGCASATTCRTRSRAPRATRSSAREVEVLVDGRDDEPACSSAARTARRPRSTASCASTPTWARPGALVRAHVTDGDRPRPRAPKAPATGRVSEREPVHAPSASSGSATSAIATPRTSSPIARLAARGPDAAAHRRRGLDVAHRRRCGSCSRAPTGSTAGSPAATAPPARARSSTRWPTSSWCIGGFVALGISGDFSWAAVAHRRRPRGRRSRMYRSFAARRGISLPAPPAREVEGVLPVPRGRRRAVPADVRAGRRSTTSSCGSPSRSRWSRASTSSAAAGKRRPTGGRCGVTSSRSAPSCCSARSSTPTARGSASSSPPPGIDTCEHRKVGDNLGRMVAVPARAARPRRRGHRVRRPRAHARRRHPRGDRRGDGRRARAARGAHRAHPRDLRRPRPADAREQPAPGRRARWAAT